jgi:thioredoxin 1
MYVQIPRKDDKMKSVITVVATCTALLLFAATGRVEEKTLATGQTVAAVYPSLASGVLTFAKLDDLPPGVMMRAGNLEIGADDVNQFILKQPKQFQEELRKNTFFVLEQQATGKLLLQLATSDANSPGENAATKNDRELIGKYIDRLTHEVKVTEQDINLFYKENEAAFCGTPLEKVKTQIGPYVLKEKKQRLVSEHLRTLGKRMDIVVSARWAKDQALLAADNAVDKARGSGKPTLAIFSAASCCGPDKMLPMLKPLGAKFSEKLNIVYVEAKKQQILTARYDVNSIPTQIFYDKTGKEIFRHSGFFSQADIEKKLADIGVK